jgi:hypothetical protein
MNFAPPLSLSECLMADMRAIHVHTSSKPELYDAHPCGPELAVVGAVGSLLGLEGAPATFDPKIGFPMTCGLFSSVLRTPCVSTREKVKKVLENYLAALTLLQPATAPAEQASAA